MQHPMTSRPWERVGADIFEFEKKKYLVMSDYYSNFFEMTKLTSMNVENVISICTSLVMGYVPDVLVSDCGTQFMSSLFKDFSVTLNFEHVMSSPHHHKSNGRNFDSVGVAQHSFRGI